MAENDDQGTAVPEFSWLGILRVSRTYRSLSLFAISLVVLLSSILFAYFCWAVWLPRLWGWGFEPTTWWKAILAVLGAFYLILIPLMPFVFARKILGPILGLYAEDKLQQKVDEIATRQSGIEDELIGDDKTGLVQLVKYSRLQLTAYYSIGLNQTQKSFRYSVLAMWIGFLVIIFGLVYSFVFKQSAGGDPEQMRVLSIAGGTVIEVISALFLWVYSRSIAQLTYFYNRQIYNHNLLICTTIASTMNDPEETKRLIIEKVLDRSWDGPDTGPPRLGRLPFASKD